MKEDYRKSKINLWEFIFLLALIGFISFVTFSIESEYSIFETKIVEAKDTVKKNDSKIEEKDIYKKLQVYGSKLYTIDNLIKYKDSIPNWFVFLMDFREQLPNNDKQDLII
jgi:hypothetical protein